MSAKKSILPDKYYQYLCELYPSYFIVKNGEILYYKVIGKYERGVWEKNEGRFSCDLWIVLSSMEKELTENDLFLLML